MLILPIQRVPRYVLLLQDLLKNTDPNHPDYPSLEESTEAMKVVAHQINTAIAQAESRAQCVRIQEMFETKLGSKALPITTLVEAHRIFVKEGMLTKQCRSERKPRRFFLFNDLLIYSHLSGPPPGKLVVDHTFFLESTSINDLTTSGGYAFQIKGYGKSFTVYADALEDKQEWMRILDDTINTHKENYKDQKHRGIHDDNEEEAAAVWIPDDQTSRCMSCRREFNMIRRRHHCRRCGDIVCGDCSKNKAIVPGVNKEKEVRICDPCVN